MNRKFHYLIALSALLASCGQGGASSSSSGESSIAPPEIDEAPLTAFFANLKTNAARVSTALLDEGMTDYAPYVTFDYYGPHAAYQTNGEYLRELVYEQTGSYPEDLGVLVHGEQGLFNYGLSEEGAFVLGDPIGFGTSLTDAGIALPETLAERSLYARGSDALHYSSALVNNLPIAANAWLSVMGVSFDESTFATGAQFVLNEAGTEATATFSLLTQEGGMPVQSSLKATITLLGSNAAPKAVADYLADLPTLPTPASWGAVAEAYFASFPGQGAIPFPSAATVQYQEITQFNLLQVAIDGANLSGSYGEELLGASFKRVQVLVDGRPKTVYRRSAEGGEADEYASSMMEVSIQMQGSTTYLVFDGSVTYKGVAALNREWAAWNASDINAPEEEGGMAMGLEIPLLGEAMEKGLASLVYEDITEYLTYLYLQAGVNPYFLKVYSASFAYGAEEEAKSAVESLGAALVENSFADRGKFTLGKDKRIALKKAKDEQSYGVGFDIRLTGEASSTVELLCYVCPAPYLDVFLDAAE